MFHLPKDERKTAVLAGTVGNVIEWYDFALYGYMASILSELFFPKDNQIASLLATYGIFAAGFLMRPIGSVFFGWLGDTAGRSVTMLVSVAFMVFPTFTLGALPTYDQVGLLAPALLVIIRLVQGLSVGGEFSSSVTYLVETAPEGKRGLSGSWANVGSLIGMLLGSGAATAATSIFPHAVVLDWAWRAPFLAGGVLGLIGFFLRRNLPKSKKFKAHEEKSGDASPIRETFTRNRREVMQGVLFASAYGALFYLALVYFPTWSKTYADAPLNEAMQINTIATALAIPVIVLGGWLSDWFLRRRTLLILALASLGGTAIPLYLWVLGDGLVSIIVAQTIFALVLGLAVGTGPAFFAELFPTRDRLTGYSITYNLGLGVVGGATPMAATWLIEISGTPIAAAGFAALMGVVGIGALCWITDRSRQPLA